MKKLLATLFSLLAVGAHAQTDHFPKMKWKEKVTPHFVIRYDDGGANPGPKAEDVYKHFDRLFIAGMKKAGENPAAGTILKKDFDGKEALTPSGEDASRDGKFKLTVYLTSNHQTYMDCLKEATEENGWDADTMRLKIFVANFADPQNRYLFICKRPSKKYGGEGIDRKKDRVKDGNEGKTIEGLYGMYSSKMMWERKVQDRTHLVVHQAGWMTPKVVARQTNWPLWMKAGFGYYAEHKILRKCRVHYVDFEGFYDQINKEDIIRGGTFDMNKPWTRPLKVICGHKRKPQRVSLSQLEAAKIATLTPEESGYMFGLASFMVGTPENVAKFEKFLTEIRNGGTASKSLLLETYGYPDDESFEKDWYDFILSGKFK